MMATFDMSIFMSNIYINVELLKYNSITFTLKFKNKTAKKGINYVLMIMIMKWLVWWTKGIYMQVAAHKSAKINII